MCIHSIVVVPVVVMVDEGLVVVFADAEPPKWDEKILPETRREQFSSELVKD